MQNECPCGKKLSYTDCCQPYHLNIAKPKSPELLMRSRFSAYALHLIDYLVATTHPSQRHLHDRTAIENWAKINIWLKLEICWAKNERVEFKAFYKNGLKTFIHHELSIFKQEKGVWYYLEGSYPNH